MFDGYLELGGTEVLNRERTVYYIEKFLPNYAVKCYDKRGFWRAIRETSLAWVDPQTDFAPWYTVHDVDSKDFYGVYPTGISGIDDSTREVQSTELSGDGAVHSAPRFGSKEIRVRGIALAKTEAAMNSGLAWLRSTLEGANCVTGPAQNCGGTEILYFTDSPAADSTAATGPLIDRFARLMYGVTTLSGPRVVSQLNPRMGVAYEIEFVLNAAQPWAFTTSKPVATTNGVTPDTVPEDNCAAVADAYDDLVVDPANPTVIHPPRPPSLPGVALPSTWKRYRMEVAQQYTARHGRVVPTIQVVAGDSARRLIRVRFYRENALACEYDGEFLITYMPMRSILTIDAITKSIRILLDGAEREVPAGNLVMGSNGRPPKWPILACEDPYKITVDTTAGMAGATLIVDVSLRE